MHRFVETSQSRDHSKRHKEMHVAAGRRSCLGDFCGIRYQVFSHRRYSQGRRLSRRRCAVQCLSLLDGNFFGGSQNAARTENPFAASQCAPLLASLPFPLEEEEIYEPPLDLELEPDLDAQTAKALDALPRSQALESIMKYNEMKWLLAPITSICIR